MGWVRGWGVPLTAALPTASDVPTPPPPPATPAVGDGRLAPFTVERPDGFVWPLTRDQAWLIPAVAQGLQVIAGTIGTLPMDRRRGRDTLPLGTLLNQPDPEEPRVSTLTRLVEDLVLFPYAYLVVLSRDVDGWPLSVRYVPFELVEPSDPPLDPYTMPTAPTRYRLGVGAGVDVPARDVLRFPSHWPGLLVVGARALQTAVLLEQAAQRFANIDIPAGTLKNRGADLPPAKVDELLSTWERARLTHTTGYLNNLVDYETHQLDAGQLQLVEARRWATAETARLLNLPSRYLNAEAGSSMTYTTVESERRDLVDLSLRPYLSLVEQRFSLDDVCPHGQRVTWDLDAFYRGDLAARAAYYTAGLNGTQPWLVVDEVRADEGRPPMTGVPADAQPRP